MGDNYPVVKVAAVQAASVFLDREASTPGRCGGSLIVAPNSRVIAGPLAAEEGILYAECERPARTKTRR